MDSTASAPAEPVPVMQLAQVLSDLVSLRVCDPAAALAMVSVRAEDSVSASASISTPAPDSTMAAAPGDEEDADLARAKNLVELHYAVKETHRRGDLARGLFEARAMVERAVGG